MARIWAQVVLKGENSSLELLLLNAFEALLYSHRRLSLEQLAE